MKITEEMSKEAYFVAKKVYKNELNRNKGINDLYNSLGMNRGSASDLINNLKAMLEGNVYHRTLNYYTTDYYIKSIRIDFGTHAYRNALSALGKHLDYYDDLNRGRQVKLRGLLEKAVWGLSSEISYPDEVDEDETLLEGSSKTVNVNSYERSSEARLKCIEKFGYKCSVCKFDFKNVYGEVGKEYIHVHHLVEIATIGREYKIDPTKDLRPVCPNCHAMLHRRKPAYKIEELREHLKRK